MYSSGSPRSGLVRSSTWSPKRSSSSRVRRLEPGATSGAGTYRHRPGASRGRERGSGRGGAPVAAGSVARKAWNFGVSAPCSATGASES